VGKDRKKGLCLRPDFDIQVFDVGSVNPKATFDLGHTGNYFRVMSFVSDDFNIVHSFYGAKTIDLFH
jgi:hypothetical protein